MVQTFTPQADAILLLGGGIEPRSPPRRPDFDLTAAGDRVVYAAQLYRSGKAPTILVTGGRLPWTAGAASEADAMQQMLLRLGVPDAAIAREDRARTTRENMRYSAPKLAQLQARRVLLVTSAMHMPRAMANARILGTRVAAAGRPTLTQLAGNSAPPLLVPLPLPTTRGPPRDETRKPSAGRSSGGRYDGCVPRDGQPLLHFVCCEVAPEGFAPEGLDEGADASITQVGGGLATDEPRPTRRV